MASTPSPTGLAVRSVLLPGNSGPDSLAFSSDGTLWITEGSRGAIGRLSPSGQLSQTQIPGESTSPGDIIQGPDGKMWFTGFELLGRVDAAGSLTGWQDEAPGSPADIGLPSHLTLGPDGAVWYTNEVGSPSINRLSADGVNAPKKIPTDSADLLFGGITAGTDGALWFTESEDKAGRTSVGRLTTDGQYESWKLPIGAGGGDITPGPDKALWFTENGGIGRISADGALSRFPLPTTDDPWRITLGTDQALWFTTDTRLGRITIAGRITLWSVPGAKKLMGLTAADNGDLWLADREASVLWHTTPPRTGSGASQARRSPTPTVTASRPAS